jgi:hypothetical protein
MSNRREPNSRAHPGKLGPHSSVLTHHPVRANAIPFFMLHRKFHLVMVSHRYVLRLGYGIEN